MNSKLRTQVLTMAVAALGLSVTACAKKAEPTAPEATEPASGAEAAVDPEASAAAGGTVPAEGEAVPAEAGGEASCGGGSCGAAGK